MAGENDPAGEFANTCSEVHSIWYGFIDSIKFVKAGEPYAPEVIEEPHYYLLGQFVGKIVVLAAWGVIVAMIMA